MHLDDVVEYGIIITMEKVNADRDKLSKKFTAYKLKSGQIPLFLSLP